MTNNTILAMVKNRLRDNLQQLNHKISDEDTARLARFLLEDLDAAQWRLVPAAPTREMVTASMTAMRKRRKRQGRVAERLKHAWRLAAGIEAAPHWNVTKQPSGALLSVDKNGGLRDDERLQLHDNALNVGTLESMSDELFEEPNAELAQYEREGDSS
ncbi:hypothetical protein AB4Z10_13165 [Bosea sp. RAF48]|uniref:hypothetical protein n=1 Tax=unclassified Bosea (in: a-proteobacteria) TaxID=2653178 RepID=UPI003F8EF593